MKYHIEMQNQVTGATAQDTFEAPAFVGQQTIVRRAKRAVGWAGKRCAVTREGDTLVLRPFGELTILFVRTDAS